MNTASLGKKLSADLQQFPKETLSINKEVNMNRKQDLSHLLQCIDSRRWAQEFCEYLEANPQTVIDEQFMVGWFSSLIMIVLDEADRRNLQKEVSDRKTNSPSQS